MAKAPQNPQERLLSVFFDQLEAGIMPDVVQVMLAISAVSDLYPDQINPPDVDSLDTDCPDDVVCPRCRG